MDYLALEKNIHGLDQNAVPHVLEIGSGAMVTSPEILTVSRKPFGLKNIVARTAEVFTLLDRLAIFLFLKPLF